LHAYEARPGAASAPLPAGYRRRDPEATVLHEVVRQHLSTFLLECAQAGGLPRFAFKDFTASSPAYASRATGSLPLLGYALLGLAWCLLSTAL
jgi:hypothetical protein